MNERGTASRQAGADPASAPIASKRLGLDFYRADVLEVAPALLGKWLCHRTAGQLLRGRITETEAYRGETDTACHARAGRTGRTQVMYENGGVAYVYLCYGIHALLNVVTGGAGQAQAALIRGIEGYSGPGRLTKALGITTGRNWADLTGDELWLEDDGCTPGEIRRGPRVGIGYATPADQALPWRYRVG